MDFLEVTVQVIIRVTYITRMVDSHIEGRKQLKTKCA